MIHTGNFKWYCETCKIGFAQRKNYDRHVRRRTELRYHCEYCDKNFTDATELKYHVSEHTGNYRLKCTSCGKGFNLKSRFEKDVETHRESKTDKHP